MRAHSLLLMTLCLSACDDGGEPARTNPAAPAVPSDETPAAAPEPATPEAERERPPPVTAEQRAAFVRGRRARRAGRRSLREGRMDEAVASLRVAAEALDTASSRCELGYAIHRAGHDDEARPILERAVRELQDRPVLLERERATFGACLYNLGRLLEESAPVRAAAMYRRSLDVRPGNSTVQGRLAGLSAQETAAPETDACAPRRCAGPFADEATLERETLDDLLERLRGGDPEHRPAYLSGEPRSRRAHRRAGPTELGDGVRFSVYELELRYYATTHAAYLALGTNEGWYACYLHSSSMSEYDVVAQDPMQLAPGGLPEIGVDITVMEIGSEEGLSNTMEATHRFFVGVDDDGPLVYGAVDVGSAYSDSMWTSCDCEEDALGDGDGEGDDSEAGEGDADYDENDEDYDDPYECCEIEALGSGGSFTVGPSERPGWIRVTESEAWSHEGPVEHAEPRELELARLGCEGDGDPEL